MKKRFTFLIAALMLLTMISQPTRLWGQTWTKTDISDLTTSDIFVIVDEYSSNALPNTQATTGGSVVVVSVELSNDKNTITSTVTDNLKWNITGNSTEGYTFYPNGTTTRRLYVIANNNGVRVANPSGTYCATFVYDSNKLKSTKSIGSGSSTGYRYIGVYNTQDWRCYTSSGGNITNTNISFYKYVASTTPSCTPDETSWNFGGVNVGESVSKTFTLTTANLTDDIELYVYDDAAFEVSPTSIEAEEEEKETEITITFHPTMIHDGGWTDYLVISSDDFDDVELIELTGEGLCNAPTNALAFQDYELTLTGANVSQTLTPTIGTGNDGAITYAMKTNPGSAGSVVAGTGVFTATATGTYVVTATQALNGTTCGDVVDITIVVNDTSPSCEITPSTGHNFGTILTNTSESFDFSVAIANLEHGLTLSVPSGYEVSPSTIAANDPSPVNVRVTFTPTAATTYNGNLSISGDDFGSPITAALSGTGDAGYTVTFKPYSGTCDPTSIRVIQGESIETLPTASPSAQCAEDDWTFHGWAIAKIDETTTAPTVYTSDYTVNSDHTLHAVYKITEGDNSNTGNVFSSGSYSNGEITWTSTGIVTINQEQHNGQTAPNSAYVSAPRWYTGNKITITQTTALDSIIVVATTSGYASALANSTYTNASASVCAWDDTRVKIAPSNSSNITIVMGGQSRLSSLTAYYSNSTTTYNSNPSCLEKVATPNIILEAGTYTSVQTTKITCETDGATIYYTTNGDEPTTASTQYVANSDIEINTSMTIKAIAVADGMANSEIASQDYVINLPLTTMDDVFAKATQIGSSTTQDVTVVFNKWVVSAVNGSSAYVTDNAGKGFIIYTSNHGFAVGDKLSGTVSDTPLKLYNGAAEFTNIKKTDISSVTGEQTVAVVTKTISELSGVNTGAIITVNNVRYDGSTYLEDPDDSSVKIKPYNGLGYPASFTADHNYNVTGMYLQFNTTKELCPRAAADIVEVEYAINGLGAVTNGTIGAQNSSSQNITTAKYGQTVTLTQSAGAGYRFISWSVNGGAVTVTDNQFTMPKGAVTVTATFAPTYAIAYSVTPANTGTVTAEPNPAIEGETVTLTIAPAEGKALKSISAYRTDAPSTPVTITDNTITMPAYGVTVAAEFATEYSVTYNVNGGTGDAVVVKYGEGATVNAAAVPGAWTAPTGKLFKNWKTVASGEGTEYEVGAQITDNIDDNIVLYAQWRDILYHVSFSVNGEIVSKRNVAYNTVIGALPADPELAPLTFLGWSSTSATGATDVTASWKPTGENEEVTVYAVFGSMGTGDLTLEVWNDMSTSYPSSEATWPGNQFKYYNVTKGQYLQNTYIQFKAAGGYIYNSADFGAIKSVTVNYYNSDDHNIAIKVGDAALTTEDSGSDEDVTKGTEVDNSVPFTISGNHHYLRIYNTSATNKVNSIEINYEAAAPLTVNIIDEDFNMTDDIEATTCVVVTNGATLNFTGKNKGNANNLVIEDGGILVTKSSGVQATVKKEVENAANWGTGSSYTPDGWYFIASPVNGAAFPTGTNDNQDIYQLDWTNNKWLNIQNGHSSLLSDGFQRGTGYLYASKDGNTVSVAGEIQPLSGDDDATVTLAVDGWNLIGNPLTCKVEVDKAFSELNNASAVTNQVAGSAINPCQGIAVYGKAGDVVTFAKAASQNAAAPSNNSSLQMTLAKTITSRGDVSTKVVDNAVVSFKESKCMPKFNMIGGNTKLFIPQDDEEYSIVFSDRQGDVPLYFKANETGTYTISFAGDEMSLNGIYLIDILAEEEIDLSVNPSYTFIGSPADRMARFKIVFRNANGDGTSDIFAYQNGNDIIVSGEGELQIFDVMGRMVSRQRVNGVEAINILTQGVYIMKLNEKTQKIVVR